MKFWKKLISMVLCLALVVGTMPIAPAMAASDITEPISVGGNRTWNGDSTGNVMVKAWDEDGSCYRGIINVTADTEITVNGTVTLPVGLLANKNVSLTIQGGTNSPKIILDNSNYKNGDTVINSMTTGLFGTSEGCHLTLKDIEVEYRSVTGNPNAFLHLPGSNGSVTLDNVTIKGMPYKYQINWQKSDTTFTLKNKVNFNSAASAIADLYLGAGFGEIKLENFSADSPIKIMVAETVLTNLTGSKGDPFVVATGATEANASNFTFKSYTYNAGSYESPQSRGVYYAEGNLYLGTGNNAPTRTKWEVNLGTKPTISNAAISGDFYQWVNKDTAMTDIKIAPTGGFSFNASNVNALNTQLSGTGLTASLNEQGVLVIGGKPTKDVSLTSITWPTPAKVEATVDNNDGKGVLNCETLADALNKATGMNSEIVMSDKVTPVTEGILKNGVTLKNSNKTKSFMSTAASGSTIDVAANGDVTLKDGSLNVENSAVTVQEASNKYVVNPDNANVEYEVSIKDGKAQVSLGENKSVSAGNGLTFTTPVGVKSADFPLDGSKLSVKGTSVTVAKDRSLATSFSNGKNVTVNATNGDVTVTDGGENGAAGSITLGKAGDSFTYGGKTYTAGSDNSKFVINAEGNVQQVSGSVALGDGESIVGTVSGKTIENPANSGNDTVKVEAAVGYDKVTVPVGGKVVIDGKTVTNEGNTPLVLKVTAGGFTVESGEYRIDETIADGFNLALSENLTITNPDDSGNDNVAVVTYPTKYKVTVPAGANNCVGVTKGDTTVTYKNEDTSNDLVLEIDKNDNKVSLKSGALSLAKDESIGLNGKTVTNNNESALTVKGGNPAEISLAEGESVTLTDKDGNAVTYTAQDGDATLQIDADGNVIFKSGKKLAVSEGGSVKVANGDDYYTVGSEKAFVVDLENKTVAATNKGDEISNGNGLTFTAGKDGSVFKLDGSELTNNGDSVKVAAGTTANVNVGDGVTVAVPAGDSANGGAVTVTKNSTDGTNGSAATVLAENKDDTFAVGGETKTATANGQQFVIDKNGNASVITAELVDKDGNTKAYGDLATMVANASAGDKVLMKAAPEEDVTATLKKDVTIVDMDENTYKAVGGDAKVSVNTDGEVFLNSGKLDVSANGSVSVCPEGEGAITDICGDGSSAFTVSVSNTEPLSWTIAEKDGRISFMGGLTTYTAGADNSKFTLGAPFENVGDSLKFDFSKLEDDDEDTTYTYVLGDKLGMLFVTCDPTEDGSTTLTKVADGHTLNIAKAGDSFEYNGKTYTNAFNDTTYHIDNKGNVSLYEGRVALPESDSVAVKAEGWKNSVSVVAGEDNSSTYVTAEGSKGYAEIVPDDSVTIGGKTYTAKETPATFEIDENGNVALYGGGVELDKNEEIATTDSGVSIKNISADEDSKVTVKKLDSENYSYQVNAPADSKVSIDGKEYSSVDGQQLNLSIDDNGEVHLDGTPVDLGKGAGINANFTKITNTGNSNLTVTKNGYNVRVNAKQGDSFEISGTKITSVPSDMDFLIDQYGNARATLPAGKTIEIEGVKYTAGEGDSSIIIGNDGKLIVTNANTAVSGKTYGVHGTVWAFSSESAEESTLVGDPAATVTLTQGGKEAVKIATVTTDADGKYQFDHVPAGIYNIVVEYKGKTLTQMVEITGDMELILEMPKAKVSSVVEVKRNAPVGAIVGGLDSVADTHVDEASNIDIILTVDKGLELTVPEGKKQIPVEISLTKVVDGYDETALHSIEDVLEIILTMDTSKKKNFAVYHATSDGVTQQFAELNARPSGDFEAQTFYVGKGYIAIYTSQFSPYTIAYDESKGGGSGSGGGGGATVPKVDDNKNNNTGETTKTDVAWNECAKDETCPIAAFVDGKPTAWYHDGVHYCIDKELMKGEENNKFNPNNNLTRAMLVTILYRIQGEPSVTVTDRFDDVTAGQWYAKAVSWAAEKQIVNGMGEGKFAPNEAISRQDLAAMLYRYANAVGIDTTQGGMAIREFSDFSSIAEYAVQAMTWAVNTQIIGGYEDNTLRPLGTATRAEAATMLMRMLENVAK